MISLYGLPKNEDKFRRLIEFFKEVLGICRELGIEPIVDGGLAVFAYTQNTDLVINDIDTGFPEAEFPRMMKALGEKGIEHRLREWHVLQVIKEDLKIELGSIEYWYKDLPVETNVLQIDDYQVKLLSLNSLIELYRRGIEYFEGKQEVPDKARYDAYKMKYDLLIEKL